MQQEPMTYEPMEGQPGCFSVIDRASGETAGWISRQRGTGLWSAYLCDGTAIVELAYGERKHVGRWVRDEWERRQS